jgi:hypothetical protein
VYQINGEDKVLAWLQKEPDPNCRQAMLDWLVHLASDPEGVASARRGGAGLPAYTASVHGCDAFVDYTVVDQYHTVMILRVDSLRLRDLQPPEV